MTEKKDPMTAYLQGKNTGVADPNNPESMRGAAEYRKAHQERIEESQKQFSANVASSRKAGESLGELIGEYLPIFVFMFFSANYIPRLIQSYFGLSADVYRNITVVGVLLLIPIFVFRRRLTGRAGWIGASVLIAAAIFSPGIPDIVSMEERTYADFHALAGDSGLAPAAHAAARAEPIVERDRRIREGKERGGRISHTDLLFLEAQIQKFVELFESSSDEMAAKYCAPEGYLALKAREVTVFKRVCSPHTGG